MLKKIKLSMYGIMKRRHQKFRFIKALMAFFMEIHKFYEGMYDELDETIDEVAERIRAIGHYAEGRLKDFIKLTHLDEPEYTTDQKQQLNNLLSDHEIVIKNLRKLINVFQDDCKDAGNADFVTGLMQKHEKMAWFIRSYLK